MRATVGIILLLYFFALLQMSFLVHFSPQGMVPNLIAATVILIALFGRSALNLTVVSAVWGGFLLDIFSASPIGFWISILLAISLFVRMITKHYVRFPIFQKG